MLQGYVKSKKKVHVINFSSTQKSFFEIAKNKTQQKKISIKLDKPNLKKRINFILSLINDFSTEISIRFCDAEEMLTVNSQFRHKQYATDVLSFPADLYSMQYANGSSLFLGDILICIPVCLNNAKKMKKTLSQELEKMLIHAIVHLKGFDHERSEADYKVMSALEKVLTKVMAQELGQPVWCTLL